MNIVTKPLAEIKPYWRNARKNEKAVPAVMQSIEEYGYINPIIVDKEGVIIAGHTRYKALSRLGRTVVEVIIVDMPAKKAKEYRILDNKTSELAEWDMNLLLPELREFESLENFTEFFPELSLNEVDEESIGQNYRPITQDEVDKIGLGMDNRFNSSIGSQGHGESEGQVKAHTRQNILKVTCPHCIKDFEVVQ